MKTMEDPYTNNIPQNKKRLQNVSERAGYSDKGTSAVPVLSE